MRRWELWQTADETEIRFIPESAVDQIESARRDGLVKIWETTASGSNDAMRQRNQFLGWGEYQPMLDDDGKPYPGDEDDRDAGPDHI